MHPWTTRRLSIVLALLLVAAPASAAPGIHLSWDHCSADGRVGNRDFACNANTGSETMIVSYESPLARDDRDGVEITMEVFSSDPLDLPAWWRFREAGSCRLTSLTSNLLILEPSVCENPWGSSAASGNAYQVGRWGVNTAQLLIAAAIPIPETFSVGPGTETFAARLVINHAKTVGTGACAGCTVPVCIGLASVKLVSAAGTDDIQMNAGGPNSGGSLQTVTWQDAYVSRFTYAGGPALPFIDLGCAAGAPVRTRAQTWGQLRSLYR